MNSILNENQYGFRPKRSTIDAILNFTQNIQNAFDLENNLLGFSVICQRHLTP